MKQGEYSTFISGIINEYLKVNYNLDMNTLDEAVKQCLTNYNKIRPVVIDGMQFYFSDSIISSTVNFVSNELNYSNEYDFRYMNFQEGDKVIDIGGNIGMVSIYLAKKYPFLKIYAFEPVFQNWENFKKNIQLNNIPEGTIMLEHKAVTSNGRDVCMAINVLNSGGSSISSVISMSGVFQEINSDIKSTTLTEIFEKNNIDNLRLLKIDCEGSEYEIIKNTPDDILRRIQSIRGEFHENKELTDEFDNDELYNYVEQFIPDIKIVKAQMCFM